MQIKNLIIFTVFFLSISFTANSLSAQTQSVVPTETPKRITQCRESYGDKYPEMIVPKGETKRAKEVRKRVIGYQQIIRDKVTKSMETWIRANPNATAEELERRRRRGEQRIEYKLNKINSENNARIEMRSWDWRKLIDVGPVLNQGEGCNTCWAFAATSAAASSLQKNYEQEAPLSSYVFPDQTTGTLADNFGLPSNISTSGVAVPFVQDLINCMPLKLNNVNICDYQSGWHGNAFDFMVYQKGIPMAYDNNVSDSADQRYLSKYVRGKKFACSANINFIKGSTWDYVNSPADKMPTVAQLKKALIEHGPLVAPIRYDSCLEEYKGGVFEGKNMNEINHAVLLIGWDDEKQAWLVKNSWGENWGEKGFAWIKYGSNNIGVFAAWIEAAR